MIYKDFLPFCELTFAVLTVFFDAQMFNFDGWVL